MLWEGQNKRIDILKVGVMHCYQCKSIPVRMQAKEKKKKKNKKILSKVWNSKIKLDTANMAKCSHALFSAICGMCKLFSLLRHNIWYAGKLPKLSLTVACLFNSSINMDRSKPHQPFRSSPETTHRCFYSLLHSTINTLISVGNFLSTEGSTPPKHNSWTCILACREMATDGT